MPARRPQKNVTPLPRWVRIALPLLWCGIVAFCVIHRELFTLEGILRIRQGNRLLMALAFLALFALKSLSVVVYCGILYIASGLLFPLPMAVALNLCGTVVMALIPYALGRRVGPELMERITRKYPRAGVIASLPAGGDFLLTFLIRSIRFLPFDIGSMYLGAAGTRRGWYLLGSAAGMAVSCVLFPLMGVSVTDRASAQFAVAAGIELGMLGASLWAFHRLRKRANKKENDGCVAK